MIRGTGQDQTVKQFLQRIDNYSFNYGSKVDRVVGCCYFHNMLWNFLTNEKFRKKDYLNNQRNTVILSF